MIHYNEFIQNVDTLDWDWLRNIKSTFGFKNMDLKKTQTQTSAIKKNI